MLTPMRGWIKDYRSFKDKLTILDDRRLEFDAERRAYHKLELKKVRQQQATDKAEPELMGKLEAKSGDVAGRSALNCDSSLVLLHCDKHVLFKEQPTGLNGMLHARNICVSFCVQSCAVCLLLPV